MSEHEKYHFLDDRPTSKDQVGTHSTIADSLLQMVESDLQRPFVIGMFGDWGVGKSSIIKMLEQKVREKGNETKVVVVDAWRKDKDTFLRQFIKRLARELLPEDDAKKICEETDIKQLTNKNRWEPDPVATKWFAGFMLLAIAFGFILLANYFLGVDRQFPADKLATIAITILLAAYFQYILPKYSVKVDCKEEDVTLHDVNHFRDIYFRKIIEKCKYETVCIVIDNLDRIEASDAIVIMRAIKTFIVDAEIRGEANGHSDAVEKYNLDKVVFIIPCDDDALRKRISQDGEKGVEFLRKFFNVAVRIPRLIDRDAYRYAIRLLDETKIELTNDQKDRMAYVTKCLFGNNPRQPKIFINNFLARYLIAEKFEAGGQIQKGVVTKNPELFAVYVALDSEFSDLPMPETADELNGLLHANDDGGRKGQRLKFLEKVNSLLGRITPRIWASYHYLKRANDSLLIPGFDELEESALRDEKDFSQKLADVQIKYPSVVRMLWDAESGDEAKIRIMHSILKVKNQMPNLDIKGRISDEMADLIKRRIVDMPLLPSKMTYEEVLKGRDDILCDILHSISTTVADKLKSGVDQNNSYVGLVKEILNDSDLSNKVEKHLNEALDILSLKYELTIDAINAEKGASIKILERGVKHFINGLPALPPSKLISYFKRFSESQYKPHFVQTVQVLGRHLSQGTYSTKDLCEAAMQLKQLIEKDNIKDADLIVVISGFNDRYQIEKDQTSLAEIVKTLGEYTIWDKSKPWKGPAEQWLSNKGGAFLRSGEEKIVGAFLIDNVALVKPYFGGILPEVAKQSEFLCHTILDTYTESTRNVVRMVSQIGKYIWVQNWVEKNCQIDTGRIESIQSGVLDSMPQMNYPEEGYKILGLLDVSGSESAKQQRENHFNNILASKPQLTIPNNLTFALRRMLLAKYTPNKDQCSKIDTAIDGTDQKTLTKDEDRDLINKYHRVKNKGLWG